MKLFKLWVHQHTFCEDALIVNPKEFPDCHIGDVLEIYHPDEQTKSKCLLLQINSLRNDFQQKDTISIEQSVANWFQLRTYSDVIVHKVEHSDVEVDLVEVVVKDQYISRSDMWRLSKALVGKCVYISKKISFCGLRGQIHELWRKGKQMICGVISKDTRVVYRSLSAQIFLYIQMSCEMWEFDLHGDLYFEKVINGFLYELFSQWKKKKANHEVTIVLFSRRFYQSEDLFPDKRKSILRDPHGRFYEDFYQVLTRGERKDDWLPVLVTLKYHINQYQNFTICQGESAVGINSTAHEGNFLEAINLSMNIFEKHYQDRNFDCTGQSILVVTPGTGVFEVDRALNSITKQRMIDSGVAVDLVCMAEQPLHSVPLLKFFDKGGENEVKLGDDYNIPHWMNHSFYASPKSLDKHNTFIPRIQLPDVVFNWFGVDPVNNQFTKGLHKNFQPKNANEQETNQILDFVNFDEFDAKIFCKRTLRRPKEKFKKNRSAPLFHAVPIDTDFDRLTSMSQEDLSVSSGNSSNVREQGLRNVHSDKHIVSSSLDHVPKDNYFSEVMSREDDKKGLIDDDLLVVNLSPVVGSADAPRKLTGLPARYLHDPRRTLFNPFKPLNIPCRWTCNRHRWAHSFPIGQDGIVIHRQFLKQSKSKTKYIPSNKKALESEDCTIQDKQYRIQDKLALRRRKGNIRTKFHHHLDTIEQDWTAEVETSVDWKSLILPACLPLTSEYCPDMKTLDTDYLEFHYELCIGDDDDSCSNEFIASKTRLSSNLSRYDDQASSHPVSVNTMITELVAQRLSKGFQILTDPPHQERPTLSTFMSTDCDFEAEEYFLSIGRNIHRLSVVPKQSQINVTRYRPRHMRGLDPVNYWYQLHIAHTLLFSNVQEAEFQHDELDKYNWNYLDQHISGIQDFAEMVESLRYWKSRFLLLPMPSRKKPYVDSTDSVDTNVCIEGMVKYLEALNGIKGSKVPRKPTSPLHGLLKPYNSQDSKNVDLAKHTQNVADNRPESKDVVVLDRAYENKSLGESNNCDSQSNLSLESSRDVSIEDTLTASSPLERIAEEFMDALSGFSFLPTTKGLQPHSFISIHCVQWMMHSVKGLNGRQDCIALAQKMVEAKIIQHASGNPSQQFVYGFVIFFINPKENWKTAKETTSNNFEEPYASMMFEDIQQKFQEDWFEVIFDSKPTVPSFLSSTEEILQYYENYPNVRHVPFAKRTRARSTSSQIPSKQDIAIGPAYKTVHINCDLQRKSNRNEYAIIRYNGNYCISHAFEFEVHWIEATGSIVHDLVQGWARKATSCGFHLVPVPVSPFPDRLGNNMDPLRLPVFIPVDVTVLREVLKSFDRSTYQLRVFLFLEAILNKFEFLKDSPSRSWHDKPYITTTPVQCRANYYIHTSGSVCAQIIDQDSAMDFENEKVGIYWTNNFTLTKKWRSSSTGDGDFATKLFSDFGRFCSNTCGSLEAFCKRVQESVHAD